MVCLIYQQNLSTELLVSDVIFKGTFRDISLLVQHYDKLTRYGKMSFNFNKTETLCNKMVICYQLMNAYNCFL